MKLRLLLIACAAAAAAAFQIRRRLGGDPRNQPTEVNILDPGDEVKVSSRGPAGSVQQAEILVDRSTLDRIWTEDSIELLARGYWAFLRNASLGLIRMRYAHDSRSVTVLDLLPLLEFANPIYEASEGRGSVTWPVIGGMLLAREGRGQGHLRVEVRRCDRDGVDDDADALRDQVRLIARVEVDSFYPGLRGSGWFARWGAWFYAQTQLRVHVIVCNAFLRSLPNLDFADVDTTSMPSDRREPQPVGR